MSEVENDFSQQSPTEQPAQTVSPVSSTDRKVANNTSKGLLYVGNLSPEVDEQDLYLLFSQFGELYSIRVSRDVVSRRSLGYAHVGVNVRSDPTSALKVLDALNNYILYDKPIRVMFTSPYTFSGKHDRRSLFFQNLAKSINSKEFYEICAEFGDILFLKISQGGNRMRRNCGLVQFKEKKDAMKAVKALNNKVFDDKALSIFPFSTAEDQISDRKGTSICFKFLPENVDETRLSEISSKYGEVISVKVERDENDVSKKFGYVNFKTTAEAKAAISGFKTELIDGQHHVYATYHNVKMECDQLSKRLNEEPKEGHVENFKSVYVKHLPQNFDTAKLMELGSPFGTITTANVPITPDGTSRGYGFICYSSASEGKVAISKIKCMEIEGKTLFACPSLNDELRFSYLVMRYLRNIGTLEASCF